MAKYGFGCSIAADTGSSSAFVDIADVINIHFPSQECSKVDVTTITQSTNYKQTVAGMREGGMLTVECFWTAAAFTTSNGLLGIPHNFKVTMNDTVPTHYTFNGYLEKIGDMTIEADKAPSYKMEITVLGAVTVS